MSAILEDEDIYEEIGARNRLYSSASAAHDILAEAPLNVYALNLQKLSKLVGCSEAELLHNMQKDAAMEMQGIVVEKGADVPFEAVGKQDHAQPTTGPYLVNQVLLTAAYRPSSLGTFNTPKCLLRIGGKTIMQHILSQLYLAKIERVVISVALKGDEIIRNVRESPLFDKMNIEFVDLGEDYREGHARSILAMKSVFHGQPFMLHTADHIFDHSILAKMLSFRLLSSAACVLVETDFEGIVGTLPSTAVKIKLSGAYVDHIGRTVDPYDGIDAGLFVVTSALFDALEELAKMKSYFSLSEALDVFASEQLLRYLPTNGDIWFSFETEEQLAYSRDHQGDPTLSPWTVFLAHSPDEQHTDVSLVDGPPLSNKSIVFSLPTDNEETLRVITDQSSKSNNTFGGFIVDVHHSEEDNQVSETTPLLHTNEIIPNKVNRKSDDADRHVPLVVSIPWMEDEEDEIVDFHHEAFLIEVSNHDKKIHDNKYMLAVPETTIIEEPPKSFTALPSDVTNIHLETKGANDSFEVTVVVDRSVPAIGFVLLISALLTMSSVGAAMDMEVNASPILKLFWRMSSTALAFLPLACFSLYQYGKPNLTVKQLANLVIGSLSYAFYCGSFLISLQLTSVGHAYIFNNTHSIIIVFGKFVFREPVLLLEGIGACFGLLGGVTTTLDTPNSSGTNSTLDAPSVKGDLIALSGAVAGVLYLTNAKKLRSILDLPVFMCCLTSIGSISLLVLMPFVEPDFTLDMNIRSGLFGWAVPTADRLPIELYLVFVCNGIGTMGYIGVMKYFDPIVVSVVMLTEPVIATVLGILVGVSSLPGLYTYIGAFFVFLGTFLVIYSASQKVEQIDATETIRTSPHLSSKARPYHIQTYGELAEKVLEN